MKCALYARYSMEKQSKESVEDQFRLCEQIAQRNGFTVIARFNDAAISGGTAIRPGYQKMLAAARRQEFDAIVAEDSSRLWRNLAEQAPRLAELADLSIAVVTHDLDTRAEAADILGAVGGVMSERYRKEIGRRTHRGQEGKALKGEPTGGRAYGYEAIVLPDGRKSRRVMPERAKTVVWIFEQYAAGWSPRKIAAELNRRGVPSPGATWVGRSERRSDAKWLASSLNCSILDNSTYTGEIVWNRTKWLRSKADSAKRVKVINPESAWIKRHVEELRIVSDELWQKVRRRRAARKSETVERTCTSRSGKVFKQRGGRALKYPLSGLLKCGSCGASLVVVDKYTYGCASNKDGGEHACQNNSRVKRDHIENAVLVSLRDDLLTPARMERMKKRATRLLSESNRDGASETAERRRALAEVEKTIANIMAAIKAGIITPTTKGELMAAEAERERLSKVIPIQQGRDAVRLLPKVIAEVERQMTELPTVITEEPERARAIFSEWMLGARVIRRKEGLYLEVTLDPGRLLRISDSCGSGGRI